MSIQNNGDSNYSTTNHNLSTTNHIFLNPMSNPTEYENWNRQIGSLLCIGEQFTSIKPILDLFIAVIEPERIFLFCHPAIVECEIRESIEILIVVDFKKLTSKKGLRFLLELACIKNRDVTVSIHSSEKLDHDLNNGHPYYSSHCKEEHLVFSGCPYRLIVTSKEILSEIHSDVKSTYEKGIEVALQFLENAKDCQKKGLLNLAGLMLHQTIEQLFKTILWSFRQYSGYSSHNLVKLRKTAIQYMSQISKDIVDNSSLESLNMTHESITSINFDISEIEDISELYLDVQKLLNVITVAFENKLKLFVI